MRLAEADPSLAERISADLPDMAAEAAFAADHEQAHSVADVLLRRTRLGLLDARSLCDEGADGPAKVARAMAGQLGWDEARVERELAEWRQVARAEGLVPAGVPVVHATAAPEEPSPTAPGAAPEEAA
jgi:glycerol-3-phosphate dehydrogenase